MFMHKSKKGFTIVELVIVIAVIAILAAVLIPTFSNLVKKANQSADIQAARQMNTVLAAEGAVKAPDIFGLYAALTANGMTAKDYKPLTTDHYFFWDDGANRIVYTDKNYQVIFPTDFEKQGNWISLTAKIPASKPAGFDSSSPSVTIKTAEEMVYVLEQINDDNVASTFTIDLGGNTIDMMGATWSILNPKGTLTLKNGTIKNATAIDAGYIGDGTGEGYSADYGIGLFGEVAAGAKITISDVNIDNYHVFSTVGSGVALLVGDAIGSKVTVDNVKITNSSVVGQRSTGALFGQVTCAYSINGVTMENVEVKTVAGRSGLIFGYVGNDVNDRSITGLDYSKNCTLGIYACEYNTGKFDLENVKAAEKNTTLGLSNGYIYSYSPKEFNADGTIELQHRAYDAEALWYKGSTPIKVLP